MNRRWLVLSLIFVGIVISYIDRGNLSIAAPSLMRDLRITSGMMGVLLSSFFWTYGAFQIPAGAIVDRWGIRVPYAIGFFVWSTASALIALSRGTLDIVGLRMLLGLAESIGPLASLSYIRSSFPGKSQGLPTAIYIGGQNIGPALGALVGTLLLDRFGWRMMFALTGLGALMWLPCWLLATPAVPTRTHDTSTTTPGGEATPRTWTCQMIVKTPVFWVLSVAILLHSYYWYFFLTWIPSYLVVSRGFSTVQMGRLVSGSLFAMGAINILAGAIADRFARSIGVFRARLGFGVAGYIGMGAMFLLLVAPNGWVLPVLMFSMCATGLGSSNFWAISQHLPPRNLVGRTIGYLNTLSQVAGAGAPVLTGWILGPRMQFRPAIILASFCPLLASVCLVALGSHRLEHTKGLLAGEQG